MLRAGLVFEGLACCKIRKTEMFLGLKHNQNADHCFEFSVALKVSAFAVLNLGLHRDQTKIKLTVSLIIMSTTHRQLLSFSFFFPFGKTPNIYLLHPSVQQGN